MRLFPGRLHELADAYVLDALDDRQRERFERHLLRCQDCARDVRVMAEAATALAMAVAAEPPAGLRDRVLADIAVTRQLPPEVADRRRPLAAPRAPRASRAASRSPWVPRLATATAVVGVAAAVALGLAQNATQRRLDNAQAESRKIAAVLTAPDAQLKSAATSVGGTATVVLSYSERTMVFTSSGLPALPASQVYELWLLGPGQPRPAGLLPAASDGETSPVLASGLASDDKVGVTVEPAGGTTSPTTTPILVMTLPELLSPPLLHSGLTSSG